MTEQELARVIWNIKEIIRNIYDDAEVEDVILPFTLLRRLDWVVFQFVCLGCDLQFKDQSNLRFFS